MKKISSLLAVCFSTCIQLAQAQIPGDICNWDNDRKAAIVLTFDDWSPGHSPIVVPELQSRSLHATFFVMNSTASYSWSQINVAHTNGNEIANHTKTHPHLTTKTPAELSDDIRGMKVLIDQHYTQNGITFAYPYGEYNQAVLDSVKASGHIAARGVQPPSGYTYNFAANGDAYYKITTYTMGPSVTATMFNTQVQNVINGGGLLTFLYHSVDNASNTYGDNWYSQVKQADLQVQLDKLASVKNTAWITTFSEAIKYHKEKNCATLAETQAPDGITWKFNLTDTLSNNTVYNQPLSIKLKKNGINYLSIIQNGVVLPIDLNRNDSIMFHAIPDGGEITLTTYFNMAATASQAANANITVSPIPSNGIVNIHAAKPVRVSSIAVIDVSGNTIAEKKNVDLSTDVHIDLTTYKEGNYLIYIYEGDVVIVKKVIRVN
jgi:peptidoglycan/xylan/chitin deacetylase (PgdA/CDA1 family)